MKRLKAIVVEDNENDLLLTTEELQRYGFAMEWTWVQDAEGLRRALQSGPCDVVLADYRLPAFSGREALELVRAMNVDVPFILVTATLGDEIAVDMMRRGADDYVLKDRMARLGHCVERAVREYGVRRERARAQQALAAVQRRFQETFEHAPIGIVHTDTDRRFIMVNDRFCAMVGYARQELMGMSFLDITHPDDHASSAAGWELGKDRGVHRVEKRYVRKDGAVIWVDLHATIVRGADGTIEYTLGMVQEITDRKAAEEKVRLQSLLLDAVEQAVVVSDLQGRVTYWNRFARDLYGWSESEALGQDIIELTTPQISAGQAAAILERLVAGESWSGELVVRRRDGSTFPAMVLDAPIFDRDGTLAGVVGVSFDLSERKATKAALQRSEERYRGVIEGVVEIIISVSPDGTVMSVNRAFEEATEWTREEIVGRKLWELLPVGDVQSASERLTQRLRGEELTSVAGHLLRRDGSAIIIDGVAYVAHDDDGAPEVFYFLRDVTDRTRAEEERARLDRQFRLVLESAHEGIFAVDADGTCTLMNRAAAQILGVTPEEMLGTRVYDLIRPEGGECAADRSLRLGTTERVRNEVFCRRDGSSVPVEYATAPIVENGAIIGAVTTFTDVSQRRMLESQLEKANRLNGLGRIAATIAHEFNNVLMGIQPFAEILRMEAQGNERMLRSIDRITTSVRRGKRVTSEILQFTRQSEPARKPIEVTRWMADVAAEARQVIGSAIDLVAYSDGDLIIDGDSAALQQVFMNLIVNARDALNGPGLIAISASRSEGSVFPFGVVEEGERFAHFTVSDNGPGMPPETMQHIFEPLFTTKKSGTGLGLALTHHVVGRHGGTIFVESAVGKGTTFHLFLPLTEQTTIARAATAAVRPEKLRNVVLVEDDPTVAAGFVGLMALEQVGVQVATTGGDALETIERAAPDAVVLDVSLPDVDGTLVYEAIARRWPTMPVVFATGHADASRLGTYLARPNVAHVLKPYQLSALYEALAPLA